MPDLTKKTGPELHRQLRLNNEYIGQVYAAGGCSCFMPGAATCLMVVERIEKEMERRQQLDSMYKGYAEP